MIFVDTHRFSPVAFKKDLPFADDYFHKPSTLITEKFLDSGDYDIDYDWWKRQHDLCNEGFTIKNAVKEGGDYLIDGKDAIWYNNGLHSKDVYIPRYDLLLRNGTVTISGRLYWYLNFWKIYAKVQGKKKKDFIPPRFIALDFFFDRRLQMMFEQEKDCQELKARQLGFSEKLGGMVLGWNMTFLRASQNVIVAGEQVDADKTFMNTYRGLEDLKNTQFYKERDRTALTEGYLHTRYFLSELYSLTAKNKEQTVSRLTPAIVIYEEIGKGQKNWSLNTASFVKASLYAENVKTGYQIYIGTGGDMDAGAADLEFRHYNPDSEGILSFKNDFEENELAFSDGKVGHFTGKQWLMVLDKDGNPEFKNSIEAIKKHIENVKPEKKQKEISQLAIHASDALMRSNVGFFGPEIVNNLQRRKHHILSHREERITVVGRLVPKNASNFWEGVEFVPDNDNGWIEILEHPELDSDKKPFGNLYKAGTDSYDQDEAKTSDSKGALVIRKLYRNDSPSPFYILPVAFMFERPSVAEGGSIVFYMHTVLACIYYGCMNNIEYSNLRIFDYYINNGFESLLEPRLKIALAGKVSAKTQVSNRYGTDKSLKPHILAILRDRLTEDYINRIYFVKVLDALAKFIYDPNYNCDITIAMAEAEAAAKEIEFVVVKSREEKTLIKGYVRYRLIRGELVQIMR